MVKEIGLLGGTFDPIHLGHIALARAALRQFNLDAVWLLPSPNPPHKTGKAISEYKDRIQMVSLSIADLDALVLSEHEYQRSGKSYTVDTLEEFKFLYPDFHFSFIMGADSLYEIEQWKDPARIMQLTRILVAFREYDQEKDTIEELQEHIAYLKEKYAADIELLHYPKTDISSTKIRENLALGESIASMVHPKVLEYIRMHKLYQ